MAIELLASSESHHNNSLHLDLESILGSPAVCRRRANSVALPPKLYTSERWFDFERAAIWDQEWICVGHASLIPDAGIIFFDHGH